MVTRSFQVHHNDSTFGVDFDTDDGLEVFKLQLLSLTSIPPDEQKLIGMDENRVVSDKSDLVAISEKLRLVSINEEQQETSTAENDELLKSDEELARMLQAEECAAPEDNGKVEGRLRTYVSIVLMYEDLERREAARKTVPVEELEEKALVSLAKEGNLTPSKNEQDHAFLLQLLFWFKQSFRWVNAPPCDGCGKETVLHGKVDPLPSEIRHGASRVEIYGCNFCPIGSRFPRYNDPLKLVETRSGRCGEWANCFTLYCRAFGYESRLILDFTNHVWTECFSQSLGRWNKKLTYVIAITKDGVCDVTKRYTRKWHEVISRRNIITETALSAVLANVTKDCRRGFTFQVLSVLEDRDEKERQELERGLHSTDNASTSLPGRLNGEKEKAVEIPRVKLGSQGFEVSKVGFGCMGLSGVYNSPVPDEDGISIIKHAFSKGITFFDTADVYGPHLNELLLGKALKQLPREKVQVATKFGITGRPDPPRITVKGTPEYVRSCCEASLNRLGVDYIDLYYQHRVDTTVPIEETVGELKKLVEEGKVKYIGLSEASPDTIRRAHAVHPITALQIEWSLWTRDIEEEIVPLCRELGIGIVPYSPLGRGFFGGRGVVESVAANSFVANHPRFVGENIDKNKNIYHRIESLAKKHQTSPVQLALSWVLHQGNDVVPIPGTTKIKNLDSNIGSLGVKLKEEDIKEISDAVPINQAAGDSDSGILMQWQWKLANTPPKHSKSEL
ncbi:peptide-N(4)-(N-acetyl-beta-glucosaminyl)asparagine amidase isoform X2 [Prunus persica]|uniref:peptide-N(4)-(N-acetyl-beta- glucosaminyl)asparagine amidase isoform X2 n=1 Tax=Prunus persica TaxID=3760 RepID=UPI0009AB818A|nr:peptide-N(4)-(N-acetyl-beta-glucosaminyl)asparagine amidase isoform X2 [Prunus persica]